MVVPPHEVKQSVLVNDVQLLLLEFQGLVKAVIVVVKQFQQLTLQQLETKTICLLQIVHGQSQQEFVDFFHQRIFRGLH